MTYGKRYNMFSVNKQAALWSYSCPPQYLTSKSELDNYLTSLRTHEALRYAAESMDERPYVDEQDYHEQFRALYTDKHLTLLGKDTAFVIMRIANDCKYAVSRDKAITDAHLR